MNCGACGKTGLRTTTLAIVVGGDGGPERKRVCNECASSGVFIVAMKRPVVTDMKVEHKNQQEILAPFIKQLEVLRRGAEVTKKNIAGKSTPSEQSHWNARVETLVDAIDLLKKGRA